MPKFDMIFFILIARVKFGRSFPFVLSTEAKELAGTGLTAFGLYRLLEGNKDRNQQLRRLSSEIAHRSWVDFLKDRKVHDMLEAMETIGETLSRNFHQFKKGMSQNVKSLRLGIKELLKRDNIRLAQLENEMTSRHGDFDDTVYLKTKRSRRLRKSLQKSSGQTKNFSSSFKLKAVNESQIERK